jgi:hypothetical protein
VHRWEHQDVVDRHRARMAQAEAGTMMKRRAALAEHPFGTLKCRAGYRHFLVRGFDKVRGEWSLMALCYNFTRMLNIVGFDDFVAYVREWLAACVYLFRSAQSACRPPRTVLAALLAQFVSQYPDASRTLASAS